MQLSLLRQVRDGSAGSALAIVRTLQRVMQGTTTTGKTHIRPQPLVPVTALAGTNVQI